MAKENDNILALQASTGQYADVALGFISILIAIYFISVFARIKISFSEIRPDTSVFSSYRIRFIRLLKKTLYERRHQKGKE